MSTTDRTIRPSTGVIAHGLTLVASHMLINDLPAPLSVSAGSAQSAVTVLLDADDLEAWTETVFVDDVTHVVHAENTHVTYFARTPDGIRLELRVVHLRLTAVPA